MIKINKYLIFLVFIFLFFIINTNTTKAATTTIDSIQDLYNVRDDLSGNYELGANLDFDDLDSYDTTTSTTGYNTVAEFKTAMTSGTGWLPIGDYDNNFMGNFDGNTYTISNLFIDVNNFDEPIGLFGTIGSGSVLINMSLENININNDDSGGWVVGGLVGGNYGGNILNSYTTGNITSASGGTGGLVGDTNYANIENSYSTVNVTGADWAVGGLVGNFCQSTTTNSYATGNVSGDEEVGGLVGENYDAVIINSYSTGDVNGEEMVGGLVGCNYYKITNSYSTGLVSGNIDAGGLVGCNRNDGIITNSYYNSQTSDQSDDDGRGSPRTTAEMTYPYDETSTTTYVGWDFDTVWHNDITGTINNGYPYNYSATTTIDSIQDLYNVRDDLSGNYELGVDLDFNNNASYDTTIPTGYSSVSEFRTAMRSGTGWLPIGDDGNPFIGNFDGKGYVISNLYINTDLGGYIGFFGFIEFGGVLINISLENINIISTYNNYAWGIGVQLTVKGYTF